MMSPSALLPEPTGDAKKKKKKKGAMARKLSILVGLCGSLVLLASTSSESILRDASSTIIPRLLAAVTDGEEEEGDEDSVAPPVDDDEEAPMNLTSTYLDHEERMTERRLASPAPPSSDTIGNEYIVGIKSWGLAYPMRSTSTTGYCYIASEVKGTFYARDGSGRCFKIQVSEGGNRIEQTSSSVAASQCTNANHPSSYNHLIGTLYSKYSYYARYTNGNSCSNGPRKAYVYFKYNKNLAFSEYTTTVSEPYMCDYRIYITVDSCTTPTDWTYRYSTYDGVQQATALMSKVGGGSINQIYQYALHGFSATLTSAQANALSKELIVDFVEPNYVVHSRSINNDGSGAVPGHPLRRNTHVDEETRRKLAIPMFNVKEPAAHWGLERVSSRGGKNGKYLYFHIGEKTHLYLFDTAINENHDEFWPFNRFGNETERKICVGSPDDYLTNNHGTHVASVAGGMNYGTARNATIHPVQVLDATGKGTTTSALCGVEWLINDQLQYNYANEVDPITNEGTGPRKSIASITWGTNGRSDALDAAIGNLAKVGGVPAVVAAGNDGANACNYSPYDPTAIMIASLDDSFMPYNARSSFSNYGSCIDFFAPGAGILGASNEGTTSTYAASGTSVAAAIATGVGALYLDEVNPRNIKYSFDVGSIPAELKVKIDRRGYRNAVTNLGAGSPNVMVTGTATVCKGNHHCKPGDYCYFGFCK